MKAEDKQLADSIKLDDVVIKARERPSCCLQFKTICRRNRSSIKRNPLVFKARVGQNVVLGVLAALVFIDAGTACHDPDPVPMQSTEMAAEMGSAGQGLDTCEPTSKNMKNLAGAMFFMTTTQFMSPFMMTTTTF